MGAKIRVLCAIGSMGGGGSERQMLNLLVHLDRARFQPLLYLIYRVGELLTEVPSDVPIIAFWDHHHFPRWNYPGRIHGMQVRHLRHVLREQHTDVVYDRAMLTTLVTAPATRRAGVPRLSAIVADPHRDLEDGGRPFIAWKRRILRRGYQGAYRVITVSEELRQHAIAYYQLDPQQAVTINNPIDLQRIERFAAQGIPDLAADRFHVVCAGRLQPQKGYPFLLQAVDELVHRRDRRAIQVHLLGLGPEEDRLKRSVEARGLGNHVVFHGFQQNPFAFFRAAHLFCLPSLYEGMPNALLEAMACGTPVLATDCPSGPRELLDGGRYGRLVPPADAPALADALEDALTNYASWQVRVEPARQWVTERHSLKTAVRSLETLLIEAAKPSADSLPMPARDA
jgi:glycosyltransferase involved in cell wall biosynthesis